MERGRARFIFGSDCTPALHIVADDLPRNAWETLHRPARYRVKTRPRAWPESDGPRDEQRRQEKHRVLRMEFKTFLNAFMRLPCQIMHTNRRLIYRLLGWNRWSSAFFRLVDRLHT